MLSFGGLLEKETVFFLVISGVERVRGFGFCSDQKKVEGGRELVRKMEKGRGLSFRGEP